MGTLHPSLCSGKQRDARLHFRTSEQHVDVTRTRKTKDISDLQELLNFLESKNSFNLHYTSLRSIATDMTANNAVNAHKAKDIDMQILKSMEGKKVSGHSLKKKDQIVTLDIQSVVKIQDKVVQMDPQLLFQRLVAVRTRNNDLSEVFCFELWTYPTALFEC